jgi:hypothetical protein
VLYREGVGHEASIRGGGKPFNVVFKYLSRFLRYVERGGGGRSNASSPPPVHYPIFVNISSKDDVTVSLLLGVSFHGVGQGGNYRKLFTWQNSGQPAGRGEVVMGQVFHGCKPGGRVGGGGGSALPVHTVQAINYEKTVTSDTMLGLVNSYKTKIF